MAFRTAKISQRLARMLDALLRWPERLSNMFTGGTEAAKLRLSIATC